MIDLAELDADQVLAELSHTCRLERRAAAWKVRLAAHWADLHSGDALEHAGGPVLPGTERARSIGGDGTPAIGEFGPSEFAAVAELPQSTGTRLIADALDLRHRFPKTWARLCAGEVDVWVCRKIATDTRHLRFEAARTVDAAIAPYLTALPPGRLFALVEAKAIEADPADAETRARHEEANRFVRTGRTSTAGIRTLIARANAGDVLLFAAMADRIAQILAWNGDSACADIRRSKAVGILANPLRAISLLAQYEGRDPEHDTSAADASHPTEAEAEAETETESEANAETETETEGETLTEPPAEDVIRESDLHPADRDLKPPINYADELQSLLELHGISPRDLLPATTAYLHLDRDTLLHLSGVVRVEDAGPITPGQFQSWLRHTNLTIAPVIDPDNTPAVDGYETGRRLKKALRILNPAEAFPYGTNTTRRVDHDHVEPFRPPPSGPRGQTSMGNITRLSRRSHRLKTHAGWQVRIPEPGTTIWRSPHGWFFLTNQAGTHPLGNGDYARTIWDTMINDFTAVRYPVAAP